MSGMYWRCRVCNAFFPRAGLLTDHIPRCVERHQDELDELRPAPPFEGDPELAAFAAAEGDVYNRRPGTRKQPR